MESNPPPSPATAKRPRRKAREVSSRYMATPSPIPPPLPPSCSSPLPSSSTSLFHPHSKHRRSPSVSSSPDATDSESEPSPRFADENQPLRRCLDTPISSSSNALANKFLGTTTQRRRAAVRLFGDNGGVDNPRKLRPGTPMTMPIVAKAAILSSTQLRAARNSTARGAKPTPFRSDDACSEKSETDTCSVSSQGGLCDSPPIVGSRARQQVSELRSSMPEADLLPSRRVLDGNDNSCCRSLNLALSSSQQNPFHCNKAAGRCIPSRICLPPHPPKSDGEARKGKKGCSRHEDVHMLRILHNRCLQWRFVNAKAEETAGARRNAAEKLLYGLWAKISEMRGSVAEKRVELDRLRQLRSLSTILELQIPYLDKWSTLEQDYSSSLAGATKALHDASLRLPIDDNVRADIKDLKEAFDSTINIFNSLSPCIQTFIPKAGAVEDVISELAELVSTERSLIEVCGNLLSEAQNLDVTECSLRSQLIQAKQRSGECYYETV